MRDKEREARLFIEEEEENGKDKEELLEGHGHCIIICIPSVLRSDFVVFVVLDDPLQVLIGSTIILTRLYGL